MEHLVFLPGIMGSRLSTPEGEEVWPPTPMETQAGYNRIETLLRSDLVVGDIIRKVWCFDFYEPLIDQLIDMGFREGGSGKKRFEVFAYDWRQDLEISAGRLAARLSQIAQPGVRITLVAHSMGGLIARLALELPAYSPAPWVKNVVGLFTLATPHLGAPLALARILGLSSDLGVSEADFKRITNDERYPSGYQLLPAPGEAACWDTLATTLPALDIYDPKTAKKLGLKPAMLARARFVFDTLAAGNAPPHVRYFFFAATGHTTVTRLNLVSTGLVATNAEDAGDGTVPMWSALPRSLQKQLVVGDHSHFFGKESFKAVFYRLLGSHYTEPPLSLAGRVDLSVGAITIRAGSTISMVLTPRDAAPAIKGTIILERTDSPETPFQPCGKPRPIDYSGPPTELLRFDLNPGNKPGHYRATFQGTPGASPPAHFTVTA